MVWRDFWRHKPVRFARQPGEIFCQTRQLTMKTTVKTWPMAVSTEMKLNRQPEKVRANQSSIPVRSMRHCRSKDSLPEKRNLSRFSINRSGKNVV
jgi:hypothetical protein